MTSEWWNLPKCPHGAHGHDCQACLAEAALLFPRRDQSRVGYCYTCQVYDCLGEHGEEDYFTELEILGWVGDR